MFNNRGAHYIKKLNVIRKSSTKRRRYGMSYEKIKDCIKDINGAIKYLEKMAIENSTS